jgi:hypothetical protein
MHAGHISISLTSFSFFPMAGFRFLNIRPDDRAIPARTCDIHPPTGQLAAAVWHRGAFRERAHSGDSKQSGLFQHAQVFRDRGERHGVGLREMRHTLIAPREMSEDTSPGGIGQSGERAIQSRGRIFNHLVK